MPSGPSFQLRTKKTPAKKQNFRSVFFIGFLIEPERQNAKKLKRVLLYCF